MKILENNGNYLIHIKSNFFYLNFSLFIFLKKTSLKKYYKFSANAK